MNPTQQVSPDAVSSLAPGSLLERLGVLAFEVDPGGVVRAPSQALRELLRVEEGLPVRLAELMPAGYWEAAVDGMSADGVYHHTALHLSLPDDESLWVTIALERGESDEEGERYRGALHDASERRDADRALRMLDAAMRMAEVGVTITDESGRILYTNPAEARMHGYQVEELIGRDARMLAPSGSWAGDDAEPLAARREWRRESVNRRRDGAEFPVRIGSDVVRDATGAAIALVSSSIDLSAHAGAGNARLHDPITGLPNRQLLADRVERAIARRRGREGAEYAVLLLGLDRFRVVIDGLGYETANLLLAQVARRLESSIRPTDTLARAAGDEFVLLLDSIEGADDAARAAIRLQQALESPFELGDRQIFITASIGITLGRAGAATPDDALRQAAIALARAATCGRSTYQIFGSEMQEEAVAALRLEIDLRHGIEAEEFRVAFQPLISLADRKLVGFEALVRWRNERGEEISPDAFVPLAEETGLIIPIDRWVLLEACTRLAEWRAIPGGEELTVSVNLSSRELLLPDLVDQVARSLRISGLDPSALRLEITESAVMENPAAAARVLEQIRGLGVKLQLDDFGTGYSSLSQLHRLPLDALKIDRSFVRGMHDERGALFIETIVVLAQHLGLSVVAEGVETEEQLHGVHALGCDYAQGFLISRPLEIDDVTALVRRS